MFSRREREWPNLRIPCALGAYLSFGNPLQNPEISGTGRARALQFWALACHHFHNTTYQCPLLDCSQKFSSLEACIQHIPSCPSLTDGWYWCPECRRPENFSTKAAKLHRRLQRLTSAKSLNSGFNSAIIKLFSSFTLKPLFLRMYGRLNRPQHFQETIPETNVSYDPAFAEISGKELMPAELPSPDPSELPDPEWLNWLEMSTETTHSTTGIVDTPPSVTASAPSPTSVPQEVGLKRNIEPTESFSFGYGRHPSSGGTFGSTIQENSPKMKIDIQPQPVKDQLIMTVGDRTHHQYHRSQSSPVQTSPYHSSAGATQEDHLNDEWASSIPDNRSNLEFGLEQKNSVITHQRRAKHTGNALHISGHSDSAYHRQAEINHLKAWQQHPKRMLALYNRDYSQVEATEVNRENMIHSQEEHRAVGPEFNGQIYRHQSDTATYDGFPQSYQQNGNSPDNSLFGKEPNVSQPSHPLASTTSSHPAKLLHRRTSSTKKVGRCPYCGQEFSDGSNLRRHIQNLHQRHWKYICPEKCGYESWRRDNVSKHCDRRHGYKLPRLKGNQRKLHKNLTVSDTPLMVDSSLNADVDRIGIDAKVFFP